MNEKRNIRVAIIKNIDVIGLDDCIYDKKNYFTLECVSQKGEFFRIEHNVNLF